MDSAKLHLADGLALPLDWITMRTSVFGVSGSGKSTFGRLLAEAVHAAGQRFCVIDLKNDWWGLKSTADGKHAAIPVVVIGGPRGDIPLDENAGAAVADIVAEVPQSFVIDLDALSKGKGIRFLGAFLERLYDVNREPLLLICDEADRYGPQKPMSVEAHVTLGAADDIARRGRKRGIGSLWLSQRPAVINKNITSQCELVVTFRTPSKLDQKELQDHIGRVASAEQVAETMKAVGGLADGQAIFMSQHPTLRMFRTAQLPLPKTFDSSATPRVGQRRIEPKQLAAPDLAALGERIKATVEKAKADDPKALRMRIAELQAELVHAAKVTRAADPKALERARHDGFVDGTKSAIAACNQQMAENAAGLRDSVRVYAEALISLAKTGAKFTPPALPPPPAPASPPPRPRVAPQPRADVSGVSGPQQRILGALAWLRSLGVEPADRVQVALIAKASPTSSAYANNLGALRTAGLIEYPGGGRIMLTAAGSAAIPDALGEHTDDEVHRTVRELVSEPQWRIVELLIRNYPQALRREEVAEAVEASVNSSAFANNLGSLRTIGVIDYPRQGEVGATQILFPEQMARAS